MRRILLQENRCCRFHTVTINGSSYCYRARLSGRFLVQIAPRHCLSRRPTSGCGRRSNARLSRHQAVCGAGCQFRLSTQRRRLRLWVHDLVALRSMDVTLTTEIDGRSIQEWIAWGEEWLQRADPTPDGVTGVFKQSRKSPTGPTGIYQVDADHPRPKCVSALTKPVSAPRVLSLPSYFRSTYVLKRGSKVE